MVDEVCVVGNVCMVDRVGEVVGDKNDVGEVGKVGGRASNGSRLSALFQIYITDMSRHLHHLTKCSFEVKKGLKGLFLHWEVIANKQTLPYFVLPSGKI